jgi:CHAD domain-containing protein
VAFQIRRDAPLPRELGRVIQEQLVGALAELSAHGDTLRRGVYSARKRGKRLRATIRLMRAALGEERYAEANALIRDAGRALGDARDAEVRVETLDGLLAELPAVPESLQALRARLVAARDTPETPPEHAAAEARRLYAQALDLASSWSGDTLTLDALISGFERALRDGRREGREAVMSGDPERLHEWRKQVKHHTHHLRLFRLAWPELMAPRQEEAEALGTALGDHHDLHTLRAQLNEDERALLDPLITARAARLEAKARLLGARIFADPKGAARQVRAWWTGWPEAKRSKGEPEG